MNKLNKFFIIFYIGLAISLFGVYSYFDSLYDRPEIDLQIPTDPLKKISFEYVIYCGHNNCKDPKQLFDALTDVQNYPKVLPKNILSVEVLNTTDNSITAIEEISENFITTKLTVKHSFIPMKKHVIEILDGDAQGTTITQSFLEIDNGMKITTDVDFNLKGILYPVGFLPKFSLQHAHDTVLNEFTIYANSIFQDDENKKAIDLLYREILLRPADNDGLQFYSKMIEEDKITIDDIRQSLINSEEYERLIILQEFNGIDSIKPETRKVINKLYLEILERPVDVAGLEYYSPLLESKKLFLNDIRNELLLSEERSLIDSLNINK